MYFYEPLRHLYNSVHLNLGIKRVVNRFVYRIRKFLDEKLMFFFYTKIEGYITRNIISHYGADYRWGDERSQNIDGSTGNLGYGLMHYALIRNLRPKRLLCIGSMYGFIPYMMAKACSENNYGHVDFVDAGYDVKNSKNSDSHFFGQGFWAKTDPRNHFSYYLKEGFISMYIMTSKLFFKKYGNTYDYIYFDGDHSFKGVKQDIDMFWPGLSNGGILAIHDIHFDFQRSLKNVNEEFLRSVGKVKFEMDKAWKLFEKSPYKFDVANGYSGLGFIQKIRKK